MTMFSNSGGNYNSAAEIVLSALKYGAPNLAVGAMVLKTHEGLDISMLIAICLFRSTCSVLSWIRAAIPLATYYLCVQLHFFSCG